MYFFSGCLIPPELERSFGKTKFFRFMMDYQQQQTNTCTMSLASFTLLVIVAAAIAVQYLRMQHASISAVGRTTISGSHNLTLFTQDGKYIEDVSIIERDPHALGHSLVLEMCLFGKGPCSNSPANPSPLERSCTPFYHYHLNQNKTITVIEGVMGYFLNDKTQKRVAKRGQTVTFPAMSAHTFWSESTNDDLLIRVRMNPPLKTAPYFENLIGLKKDAPNDWLNLLYTSLESEVYLGELSIMMNRALAVVVEILAKLTGKKAYYKEYTTGAVPSGYEY